MVDALTPLELFSKLKKRERLFLLDVREPNHYADHHFFKSKNIPIQRLNKYLENLPKNIEIVVVSNSGANSVEVAHQLEKKGFIAGYLDGGYKAWNKIYDIVKIIPIRPLSYEIFQVKRLGKGCLSYIIVDERNNKAIIVDPSRHIEVYLNFLNRNDLSLYAVFDTHIHYDHISGCFMLSKKFGVPYLMPKNSKVHFPIFPLENFIDKLIPDEVITVYLTPGHTPESTSICLSDTVVFSGDTLFLEHIGRFDSNEKVLENARLLYTSIVDKLFSLDENVFVLPSHTQQTMMPGGSMLAATMRYIKRANGISKISSVAKFLDRVNKSSSSIPPNHKRIKEINQTGNVIDGEDLDELELGGNGCAASL